MSPEIRLCTIGLGLIVLTCSVFAGDSLTAVVALLILGLMMLPIWTRSSYLEQVNDARR